MSARTAGVVLLITVSVGLVLAAAGFVLVARADTRDWLGAGLMQLGIVLMVVPAFGIFIARVRQGRQRH